MRLVEYTVDDHCVVLCGSRGVIIYSAERYNLGLSAESLRLCSSAVSKELRVGEIREAVRQKECVNTKHNKCRKVSELLDSM